MGFVPAANTAMVECIYLLDGQVCENTLYFSQGSAWSQNTLEDLANDVLAWWDAHMQPLVSPECALTRVKATDIASQTGPVWESTPISPLVGTGTGNALPNNVTVCISLRTASRGRSFRGRNYIPGMTDNMVSLNEVLQAYADNLVAAYEKLLDPLIIQVGALSIVSRITGGSDRTNAVVTAVTGFSVDPNADSMRNRLPGRGN